MTNTLQERLQLLFHEKTLSGLYERYLNEEIDCDMDDISELATPAPLVNLIDKQVRGLDCKVSE